MDYIMHICPNEKKPVDGKIIGCGTMTKKAWIPKEGLSGEELFSWKTIIVKCKHCGDHHEYALVLNPEVPKE